MNTTRTILAVLLLGLLLGAVAFAQEGADPYQDPLAFSRVDPAAEALPLTVYYQATGETREAMGRTLLAGSDEMYLRSSTLAAVLKAGRYWQGALRHLELKISGQDFRVTAGSRVAVSYTHLTLPTTCNLCRSRWSPYH